MQFQALCLRLQCRLPIVGISEVQWCCKCALKLFSHREAIGMVETHFKVEKPGNQNSKPRYFPKNPPALKRDGKPWKRGSWKRIKDMVGRRHVVCLRPPGPPRTMFCRLLSACTLQVLLIRHLRENNPLSGCQDTEGTLHAKSPDLTNLHASGTLNPAQAEGLVGQGSRGSGASFPRGTRILCLFTAKKITTS